MSSNHTPIQELSLSYPFASKSFIEQTFTQASISALQGLMEQGSFMGEADWIIPPHLLAERSCKLALALTEEILKNIYLCSSSTT